MADSANQLLLDADTGHQHDLVLYANGVVRRMAALLNSVEADLAAQLALALEGMDAASFAVERLDSLLRSVRELNAAAYEALALELPIELRALVEYEAGYQLQLFQAVIPPQVVASVGVAQVATEQVYAAAMARPFQGRLLREWAAGIEEARMARIRDQVRIGFVEQQTIPQIVQRIRGTKAKGYSDGAIEIDRRSAEAVVRTAVSHTAGYTRDRFFDRNGDLIKAVRWLSTLDLRTSPLCRVRDGLQYTADDEHKPIGHRVPWLAGPGAAHWQCRSSAVPVLKSWRDLGGADLPRFTPETRASMDGQVPADQTYSQWLAKQSAARQDDILGSTRGRLLRQGGLTVDRFSNDRGRWLSLEELRKRDAEAFRRAGL